MLVLRSRLYVVLFVFVALAAAVPPRLLGQASPTASRGAALAAFGGFQIANPAYGPNLNFGGVIGVDYTRFFHIPVQPSLEIRANFNNGYYADQRSYLFGLRALAVFGRLQPYGDFLVGPGTIHFPHNNGYFGDNSIVYNYGGGVDFDITRNFALKLDVQSQRWNTGEIKFTPLLGTVGVTYHIPFKPHITQATIVH